MKILVAEDEPLMRKTIEMKLTKDGHQVIPCADGKEALEKIVSEQPDLVVTDIMLPFASGLEIIGVIKKMEKPMPVIVLSALGQEKTVEEAFNLGADDYITKPFSLNELSIRVRKLSR